MKRYLFFVLWLFLQATVSQAEEAKQPLKLLGTASIMSDIVANIAGDKATLQNIVPVGGDPHLYEPLPNDSKLVREVDMIFRNGLTFEGWLDKLINNSGTKAPVITITEGVNPITSVVYKNSTDPHAWMDVTNAMIYAKNVEKALSAYDPQNADYYKSNLADYLIKLKKLDEYVMKRIQEIPEDRRVLITSHDAFQYYGKRYGLSLESILGVSTDSEAQTADIMRLNKLIGENNIPAVFIETTVNPKLLKELAKENDIRVGGSLYSDSIGEKDSPAPTYVDMIRFNTNTIVDALSADVSDAGDDEGASTTKNNTSNYWLYGLLALAMIAGLVLLMRKLG